MPLLAELSCEIGTKTAVEHLGHLTRLPRSAMLTRIPAPQAQVTRNLPGFCGVGVPRSNMPVAVSDSSFGEDVSEGGTFDVIGVLATARFRT